MPCNMVYCDLIATRLNQKVLGIFLVTFSVLLHHSGMGYPCGFPGRPRNGSSTTLSTISRPGDTAQYSCRPGFTLFGDTERVCLESGIWAGQQPICELNLVLKRPTLMSAQLWHYAPDLAVDGNTETCSFTPKTSDQRWWQVDLTYQQHIGSVALVISRDSYYELTIFITELVSKNQALYKPCIHFKGKFPNLKMLFVCNKGKGHRGRYVYIRDDRKNHDYFGLCEVEVFAFRDSSACGDPEEGIGSKVAVIDGTAMYTCLPGYRLVDPPNRTCEQGGHWTGHSPQCREISCGQPSQIGNAEVELLNRSTTWNSIAAYSCKAGYYFPHGSKYSTVCQDSGMWEPVNLTCVQDDESKHQMAVKSRDKFRSNSDGNDEYRSMYIIVPAGIISGILLTITIVITVICRCLCRQRYKNRYNTAQSSSNDLLSGQSKKIQGEPDTPCSEQQENRSIDGQIEARGSLGEVELGMDILTADIGPSTSTEILGLHMYRQLPRSSRIPDIKEEEYCRISEEFDCIRYSLGNDFPQSWENNMLDRQNKSCATSNVPFTQFKITSNI